ncbi:two-component system OmpR family sensor kinase [Rhodovulum imhoffii]|uniref:histidine kinase n=1 Tax=Rhodovulum imhoffii TaxID=365340 RepID=A0A2T5BS95_9RHOB|nr:ATP-binding protein [Rhodovulum imhoffii]MBK5934754.1 two-component sensor histidine kinase [Rhodovulum imhoffii]PTN02178.1 two-component system OmpR family sensor kinase [Rhodovulum imhoffii]
MRSLQARLGVATGLAILLSWLAAAAVSYAVLSHEIGEVFDSALEETAQRVLPLAVMELLDNEQTEGDRAVRRVTTLRRHGEYFTYLVRDAGGNVLIASHAADPADFPPFSTMGFHRTATHRLYSDAALGGGFTITVAEPLRHRQEVARETLVALGWPLVAVIPLTLLAIWGVVRLSLRPVRRFRLALETRGAGDLSPMDETGLPAELLPLAQAQNRFLDRVRDALEAERSFTANAAHELRTPLAAALAQVQRLYAQTEGSARRRTAEVEQALQRLVRLSEKLMQLARAEGGRLRTEAPFDVREVVRISLRDFSDPRLDHALAETPVMSDIDPDALSVLLRNLVENALRHGQGPVRVELSAQGVLAVSNGGPVLDEGTIARLMRRFQRGATRAEGSGLGLSIVQAIADGSGGRLRIASPAPGREDGMEVFFELPR